MDILTIASLVSKGVGRLAQLVPLWLGAKTPQEREAIQRSAQKSVDALDAHFSAADAHDKIEQEKLQSDIDEMLAKARAVTVDEITKP